MPARLYVMVGIPGSGKTSYARLHLPHALRVSFDDLRLMMTGQAYVKRFEPLVIRGGEALLTALLERTGPYGLDLLLDATNATRLLRRRYVNAARAHGVSPVAVYLQCDLTTAIARDAARPDPVGEAVLRRFHARMQPPRQEEGFSEVLVVPAP